MLTDTFGAVNCKSFMITLSKMRNSDRVGFLVHYILVQSIRSLKKAFLNVSRSGFGLADLLYLCLEKDRFLAVSALFSPVGP